MVTRRKGGSTYRLQSGGVDDLVVDHKLTTTIIDDQSTNATAALGEGVADLTEHAALGNDRETLADVAGLGHSDDGGIVVEVKNAVGLVDRAKHGLDNDRRTGVRDEARLLLQLAVEQVNAQVAVLTGLGRHRDTDHLARTALEDQDVTNADEVAGDRDGVGLGAAPGLDNADVLPDAITDARGTTLIGDDDLVTVMVVERVGDALGRTLNPTAEGVVVAFVVVVTHLAGRVVVEDRVGSENFDVGAGNRLDVELATVVSAVRVDARSWADPVVRSGLLVRPVERDVYLLDGTSGVGLSRLLGSTVVWDVDVVSRVDATAIISLSYVELAAKALVVARGFAVVVTGKKVST